MVTSRPIGVRGMAGWSGTSRHFGLSPTIPGWIALTRCGAISLASVRTSPVTPPLNAVTIVDPG